MATQEFVDYYDLLQISQNAELSTISRVYKHLAARFHPDNPETADVDRFLVLKQAYEVLSDPVRRAEYDRQYSSNQPEPVEVFTSPEFTDGIEGEKNRRMGVLCLLYHRRRIDTDKPGLSLLDLEQLTAIPREHLLFPLWYLKEKHLIRQDDSSNYFITAEGTDYVEDHLPNNRILYKLLKAAEPLTPEPGHGEGSTTTATVG